MYQSYNHEYLQKIKQIAAEVSKWPEWKLNELENGRLSLRFDAPYTSGGLTTVNRHETENETLEIVVEALKEEREKHRELKEAVKKYVNSVPFNSSGDVAELALAVGLFPDELRGLVDS